MSALLNNIQKIPKHYFSLNDIQKVSPLTPASLRVSVSRLASSGALTKLGGKLYTIDPSSINWMKLASELYYPSYVSFESALSYHNILSQQPIHLSLATTKRTKNTTVGNKNIFYHHIQEKLFWGYVREQEAYIADPEKAFLDIAYLSLNGYATFDPEEMNLSLLKKSKITTYLRKFDNKKLSRLITRIL